MFVLTIDQDDSRTRGDLVEELLTYLDVTWPAELPRPAVALERTIGDEVQGVFADAGECLHVILNTLRIGGWQVGLGIGQVKTPLPERSRDGSGSAFVYAREAVERSRAKGLQVPVSVRAANNERAAHLQALLRLIGGVIQRRTEAGWAVIDALSTPSDNATAFTQRDIAEQLGVSAQAVSQRLRAALWAEERDVHPLAIDLLKELDS